MTTAIDRNDIFLYVIHVRLDHIQLSSRWQFRKKHVLVSQPNLFIKKFLTRDAKLRVSFCATNPIVTTFWTWTTYLQTYSGFSHLFFCRTTVRTEITIFSAQFLCLLGILFFLCIYFIFNRFCAWQTMHDYIPLSIVQLTYSLSSMWPAKLQIGFSCRSA